MLKLIADNREIEDFNLNEKISHLEKIIKCQKEFITFFHHDLFNGNFSEPIIKEIDKKEPLKFPDIYDFFKEEGIYTKQFHRPEFPEVFQILSKRLSEFLINTYNSGIVITITNEKNLNNSLKSIYTNPNNFINDYNDLSFLSSQAYFNEKAANYWIDLISSFGNALEHHNYLVKCKDYYEGKKNIDKPNFRELNLIRRKIRNLEPLDFS